MRQLAGLDMPHTIAIAKAVRPMRGRLLTYERWRHPVISRSYEGLVSSTLVYVGRGFASIGPGTKVRYGVRLGDRVSGA